MFWTSAPILKLKIPYVKILRRRKNLNYSLFIRFCLPTLFPLVLTFGIHFLSFTSFPTLVLGRLPGSTPWGAKKRSEKA